MEFIASADLDAQIVDVLNAAAAWSGSITAGSRSAEAVELARRQSCIEVLRAIASNPEHGCWGELATLVDVEYANPLDAGVFLPGHAGEIGIPKIVPFAGAAARDGYPADPDEIDSYRLETVEKPRYTGGIDGVGIPHDQPSEAGDMSPISCRYSLVGNFFKFTGLSAQVPMIVITDEMADTKIAIDVAPAVTKCAIPKLVKPGDNVYQIAQQYGQLGKQDLIEIAGGAMKVLPLPAVAQLQPKL